MDFSGASWRKCSLSSQQGSCVEVAAVTNDRPRHVVGVRDSKDPSGPVLPLAPEQWQAFTGQIKAGTLSLG
ncbi:MAG: DUF397 domain-containing protein [Streptosporangiaceae bacterium]